jgi:predicted double-glycine peptidase
MSAIGVTGCSGTLSNSGAVLSSPTLGEMVIPTQTIAERRFAGVIRQRFDFSCGSAALATLLRHHYGKNTDEAAAFKGMWAKGDRQQIRRLGFSLLDMKRYLESQGLPANGFKVTLDQIAEGGTPGIALVNERGYKHFVVVKGVRGDEVLLGDPSTGLEVRSRAAFQRSWNGVFFIIQPGVASGRFNAPTFWASFTRAPLGSGSAQPLSQQALALTAPFYRDF